MSFSDLTEVRPLEIHDSEVESRRFGYRLARCTVAIASSTTPIDISQAIEAHGAEVTIIRYPAERAAWFARMTEHLSNHVVIYADTLIYWELKVGSGKPLETVPDVRTTTPSDLGTIGDLASRIFAGYVNHYSANPLLSAQAASDGYTQWAMTTHLQDAILLLEAATPVGLATFELTPEYLEILLAGVVPSVQGRGLYAHLLKGLESRARDAGLSRVVISTQVHNAKVQRAWARYGLEPLTSFNTIHAIRADVWASAHS